MSDLCECEDAAHGDVPAGEPTELVDDAGHAFLDRIPPAMGRVLVSMRGQDSTVCDLCLYAGHDGWRHE
jgi:hypothetical protein